MSVLALVIVLVLLGLLAYGVKQSPFLGDGMKKAINIVIFVVVVMLILEAFGLLDVIRNVRVPRVSWAGPARHVIA